MPHKTKAETSEHTKKYSPSHNQYKNNKTIASGEWTK